MSAMLSIALMFATVLGGVFGEATATGSPDGTGKLNTEFTVQVAGDANAVVAHILDIGGDQSVTSLAPQGAGEWSGTTVTDATNLVVVFEAIGPDDSSDLSDPVTLAALGVDPSLLGLEESATTTTANQGYSRRTLRWGWGALALAALALAFLALWAAGGRSGGSHRRVDEEPPQSEQAEVRPAERPQDD
jgi:hypothetical protein